MKSRYRIYLAVREYLIENQGRPPTIREICELTDIESTNTVNNQLVKLIAAGYLVRFDKGTMATRNLGLPLACYQPPPIPDELWQEIWKELKHEVGNSKD